MELYTLNELTFLEYSLNAAASLGGRLWGDGAWRAVTTPASFLYSCVFALEPEAGEETALARELAAGVRAGTLPDHLLDGALPEPLRAALRDAGFEPFVAQTLMSRDLDLPFAAPRSRVVTVPPERVREWVDCLNAGMGVDPTPYEMYEVLIQNPNICLLASEADGRFVSTLCLATVGGFAGLHEGSTLPEMRGRGLVSDLFLRAMFEAKTRGFGRIFLQASDMGRPVYEKLGFTVDGTLTHWRLRGE